MVMIKGLIILGPFAIFSTYKLTTSSGKHLEDFSDAHSVSSMQKLKTSAIITDDLSIGLDQDCRRRLQMLTNTKNLKRKFHVRIMLNVIFGFPQCQQKATWRLGYKITLNEIKSMPF